MKSLRESLLYVRLAQVQLCINWNAHVAARAQRDHDAAWRERDRLWGELHIMAASEAQAPDDSDVDGAPTSVLRQHCNDLVLEGMPHIVGPFGRIPRRKKA